MDITLLRILHGLRLLIAGLGCGLVNTLASSGSAISLPVLLMFGLSPLDANATNRLSVLFGSLMALHTFQAKSVVEWRAGLRARHGTGDHGSCHGCSSAPGHQDAIGSGATKAGRRRHHHNGDGRLSRGRVLA